MCCVQLKGHYSLVYFVGIDLLRNDLKETGDMAISVLLVKHKI